MAAAPKFGSAPREKSKSFAFHKLAVDAAPDPTIETFPLERAEALLGVSKNVIERAKALLGFVDTKRALARQAGIETIGIEVSSIIEGGRLDRVMETLERAALKKVPGKISADGLQTLRRTERLLAEAADNVQRYADRRTGELARNEGEARRQEELRAAKIALEERRLEIAKQEERIRQESLASRLDAGRSALSSFVEGNPWDAPLPSVAHAEAGPVDWAPRHLSQAPAPSGIPAWVWIAFGVAGVGLGFAIAFAIRLSGSERERRGSRGRG